MEKVEEETKNAESEGVDKFLQLIMDESRESANNDGLDKPKSKKHKKHKKSKKAAITLDEFLNMNKDVFGDGLDVQGIEEVPTQQVLKKCKGTKKHITAKTIPTSAIAKLKKQGVTVKTNSGANSPTFNTNMNLTINKPNTISTNVPMKGPEKPKVVTTSNDLLCKLLNQGNNQIKVVKKSTAENLNNEIFNQSDREIPASTVTGMTVSDNNISVQDNEAEAKVESNIAEVEQNKSHNIHADDKLSDKDVINNVEKTNATNMVLYTTLPTQDHTTTSNHDNNVFAKLMMNNDDNDTVTGKSEHSMMSLKSRNSMQFFSESDIPVRGHDDSLDTNGDDIETNGSDDEYIENITQNKHSNNELEENQVPKNSFNSLKHLKGCMTVKSTRGIEDDSNIMETDEINVMRESEELPEKNQLKDATNISKSVPKLSLKYPHDPQKKVDDTPSKTIDTLKILNKQITITPCVTSTAICYDINDPGTYNPHDNINTSNKNIINEKDNANFKTPMSITKPGIATTILKRLTNVTAKPIPRATNIPQENLNPSVDFRQSVVQKNDLKKQIDQDIEIFNIDDSDSDQELANEESLQSQVVNIQTSSPTKIPPSVNVLKNLSKNITIKSNPHKNVVKVKNELYSDQLNQISDEHVQSSINNDGNFLSQNKPMTMNAKINHTLKKLGNNISIKSPYSSSDTHRYQTSNDKNIDDHFDMIDEVSDFDTTNRTKVTELQEDDENLPSDSDMEYNENVLVKSPFASNSENEEETQKSHDSDEERNDDFEEQIKTNTLRKEKFASKCLDNFKRNNKELTIKSLNDKCTVVAQTHSFRKKPEEPTRIQNKLCKDIIFGTAERHDAHESLTRNINESATSSTSSQKITNQVNTVKTVKTFQSETVIEEITTTVTKTIRTVNQSSKQVPLNANVTAYRPRLMVTGQQPKLLQGMTVRNAQSVGTKIRNATPVVKPTPVVPMRTQSQIKSKIQVMSKPNAPGPLNIKKTSQQPNVLKPVVGKQLKISPLAMNQTLKRNPDIATGQSSSFKRPKDSTSFDDDNNESMNNYSSASSSRSDYSTTATSIVRGKSVVSSTQSRSEQHSEQQMTKLSNMAGIKIVRNSAKQAFQVETRNDMTPAKRTTLDAIEKLQKQGLLVKKPRIEAPDEREHYNSDNDEFDEDYEEND